MDCKRGVTWAELAVLPRTITIAPFRSSSLYIPVRRPLPEDSTASTSPSLHFFWKPDVDLSLLVRDRLLSNLSTRRADFWSFVKDWVPVPISAIRHICYCCIMSTFFSLLRRMSLPLTFYLVPSHCTLVGSAAYSSICYQHIVMATFLSIAWSVQVCICFVD